VIPSLLPFVQAYTIRRSENAMSDSFYITTPIYYVNDKPHIGHAYTTILADVLARYHRLLGQPTWFLTGTDEHGQKVQQAAEKGGVSPQEHADKTVKRFLEAWDHLEITNDDFIRTTEGRHTEVVQEVLQDLYDRGEIYKADYDGWYDVTSETFVTEKQLEEAGGPENLPNVTRIQESNYFFRMSHYQEWLIEYINEHPEFIQPSFRRNETLGFLKKPLGDLCISRPKSRLNWGIELPFDSDFVTYVWFDALVNYISAIGYQRDVDNFNQWWPASCHLIGKDILTTHTVYWPTMLKAMGVKQPKTIFAHGWWLSGADKMSKSLGNVVNPLDMGERYGVDALRYFLISEMSLGQDSSFTEELFVKRYNADLANDLGNLLNLVINMINKYCGGELPDPGEGLYSHDEEGALWKDLQQAVDAMVEGVQHWKLNQGLSRIMEAVRATNRFLEQRQPWTLAKNNEIQLLNRTLYAALEAVRICSGLLSPVMPGKMAELRAVFGEVDERDLDHLRKKNLLKPGIPIEKPSPLFPRIEWKEPELNQPQEVAMTEEAMTEETPEQDDHLITYDQFSKVKLMTGKVLEAEKVEGADKLLKLAVMVDSEKRQIVAGLARHYEAEALVGMTVVIVANLKPAVIRGVESQGMILAASKGESVRLVTVDGEISSGASVK
jgi:methionyl-tRNA synthetase